MPQPRPTSLASDANRALAIKLLAAATTYGFSIFLARLMGARDFGTVAFFLNAALFLSVLGARGQQVAALRFLPPMIASGDVGGQKTYLRRTFWLTGTGSLAVFALALVGALGARRLGWLADFSTPALVAGLALVPLVGWVDLQSHLARSYQRLTLALAPKEILWRALAALAVAAMVAQGARPAPGAVAVLAVLIATLALIAAGQGLLLARAMALPRRGPAAPPEPDWGRAAGPFWISSVSNIFLANADVLAVGIFAGAANAGIYFAANRLAMLLAFFTTSYNIVLGPALSQAWHAGRRQDAARLVRQATLKMTLPTLALGAMLGVFAPQVLALFGPGFAPASDALRLLLLAGVLNAASGPADIALNMCGAHRAAMRASALSLGLGAALLGLGVALGGVNGVALAVLVATVLRKAMYWWLARRLLGLRCDILACWPNRPRPVEA